MPVTIVVGTNSYVDVKAAEAYLNERLFADEWINASDDDKARALIMATKKIDRQPLKGIKADSRQVLQFPRAFKTDFNYASSLNPADRVNFVNGWQVEPTVTKIIKDAVCEEALGILQNQNSKRVKLQQQGVTSVKMGDLTETYNNKVRKLYSQEAMELLKPYLAGSVVIS